MEYINPTGNKVLIKVEVEPTEEVSQTGIVTGRSVAHKDILKGEVIGIGADVKEVQVGDFIAYEIATAKTFTFNGVEHTVIPEGSVMGFSRKGYSKKVSIND